MNLKRAIIPSMIVALLGAAYSVAQVIPQPGPPMLMGCAYNTSPPTLTNGQAGWVQCDSAGSVITSGGGGGGGAITSPLGSGLSATAVRTVEATDSPLIAAINLPVPLGSTSNGMTPLKLAALTNTAVVIKASAGQLYKLYCYNPNASVTYIQVYNVAAAGVTVGTTAALQSYGIPATSSSGFTHSLVGDQYGTAISAAATTTAGGGTAPGTAVDCNVSYN